jgi:hypothetical protein
MIHALEEQISPANPAAVGERYQAGQGRVSRIAATDPGSPLCSTGPSD